MKAQIQWLKISRNIMRCCVPFVYVEMAICHEKIFFSPPALQGQLTELFFRSKIRGVVSHFFLLTPSCKRPGRGRAGCFR